MYAVVTVIASVPLEYVNEPSDVLVAIDPAVELFVEYVVVVVPS